MQAIGAEFADSRGMWQGQGSIPKSLIKEAAGSTLICSQAAFP